MKQKPTYPKQSNGESVKLTIHMPQPFQNRFPQQREEAPFHKCSAASSSGKAGAPLQRLRPQSKQSGAPISYLLKVGSLACSLPVVAALLLLTGSQVAGWAQTTGLASRIL